MQALLDNANEFIVLDSCASNITHSDPVRDMVVAIPNLEGAEFRQRKSVHALY